MVATGIRFFAEAFWNLFAMIAESCRRVFLAWARVDRLACWLAVGMLILAPMIGGSFCYWVAIGAVICLSIAAWRGERWDLKKDVSVASGRFRGGWERGGQAVNEPQSNRRSSRTTFAGPVSTPRKEIAVEALKPRFGERIVGQNQAQDLVLSKLASLILGTRPKTQAPMSFLFVGPTGTGKGEFASLIAEVMGRNVAKFNMGEYNNDQTLWTLLGSPKGYANPEEGLLTRAVRNDPGTVLFFDEILRRDIPEYLIFSSPSSTTKTGRLEMGRLVKSSGCSE